jgi:hypothetical protein
MEIWKRIFGFPGYEVSTHGRIRSFKDFQGRLMGVPHMIKPIINNNGYRKVVLYDQNAVPHQKSIHRLVAMAFIPTDNRSLVVDHLDGDKSNNHVDNLEWVSNKENSIRAYNMGLYEPTFAATRRPIIVTDLRNGDQSYYSGVNEAARKLGFSSSIISRNINGLTEKFGYYSAELAGPDDRLLYTYYLNDTYLKETK